MLTLAVRTHQIRDFTGKQLHGTRSRVAHRHVVPGLGGSHLVDRLQMRRQVFTVTEIKKADMAIRSHKDITARVMQTIDLHVAGITGITDIDRVEQHNARQATLGQPLQYARLAVGTQPHPSDKDITDGMSSRFC